MIGINVPISCTMRGCRALDLILRKTQSTSAQHPAYSVWLYGGCGGGHALLIPRVQVPLSRLQPPRTGATNQGSGNSSVLVSWIDNRRYGAAAAGCQYYRAHITRDWIRSFESTTRGRLSIQYSVVYRLRNAKCYGK